MFVCSRFLISVCMFNVSKAHIECYSDCSRRGAICLNPFATVLFRGCSAVNVECCVCTRVAWVCLLLCREEGSSPVSAITERRDTGLYEVPLSVSLLGFGIGTMITNFHVWGIMFLLRAVLNILMRNASPRGLM